MEKELIIKVIICASSILFGYIIGRIVSYYKNRVQCTNCGSHDTYLAAAGYGGEGGVYEYVVKHSEQHVCNKCDKTTFIKMKLIK